MKKIFLFAALTLFVAFSAKCQFRNLFNSLSTNGNALATDTVTNTGTGLVQVLHEAKGNVTSVTFTATKISGTVAGTVALHGSNDGTNFASIHSTTFTATDVASQGGTWQLVGNPFRYYRVTWTGSGTMAATVKGTVNTNQLQ